jgi:hypothetical protein
MDIDSISVLALVSVNFCVLLVVSVYLFFFYKWDTKTYDPLADNVKNRDPNQNWENLSNVEYLLEKGQNDSTVGPGFKRMQSGLSSIGFATAAERNIAFNDLTSIASRRGGGGGGGPGSVFSHRYSILTRDKDHSILGFGTGNRYAAS